MILIYRVKKNCKSSKTSLRNKFMLIIFSNFSEDIKLIDFGLARRLPSYGRVSTMPVGTVRDPKDAVDRECEVRDFRSVLATFEEHLLLWRFLSG